MRVHPRWAVVLVALCLVGLELLLHHAFGYGRAALMESHATLGWRWMPSQRVLSRRDIETRINSEGYRDREWLESEEPGTLRVALLGDSLVHGTGVRFDATMGPVLERELAALCGRPVVVRSMAVGRYNFELMARTYEQVARPWNPHFVVFAIESNVPRPVLPTRPPVEHPLRRRIARLALSDWFQNGLLPWVRGRRIDPWRAPEGFSREDEARVRELLARFPAQRFAPEMLPLWEAFGERLHDVARDVAARGGRTVVAAIPRFSELVDPSSARMPPFLEKLRREGLDVELVVPAEALARSVEPLLARMQEHALDPQERLELDRVPAQLTGAAGDLAYLADDLQHLSPLGHRLVAEAIARELHSLSAQDAGGAAAAPAPPHRKP